MSKVNLKLSIIKNNAIKLRVNSQLPYYLVYLISKLTVKDDISYIKFLMSSTEHMLRTKGYYKKYPEVEKAITEELKKAIQNRTYLNI